jgi:hypothetical protein
MLHDGQKFVHAVCHEIAASPETADLHGTNWEAIRCPFSFTKSVALITPDTWSFSVGELVPMPILVQEEAIPIVLASKSKIPSTIRFQDAEDSCAFGKTLSEAEIPPFKVAETTDIETNTIKEKTLQNR